MIQANRVGTMEEGCRWPGNGRTWVFMEQLEGTLGWRTTWPS